MDQRSADELTAKLQEVLAKISEKEKRVTPQRVLLTKLILSKVKDHPSLKELFEEAQEQLPRVGISTVYNTIRMLESLGVIDVIMVGDKLRIDQTHPHINVLCTSSGQIFDVDGDVAQDIMSKLESRGVKVRKILVEALC